MVKIYKKLVFDASFFFNFLTIYMWIDNADEIVLQVRSRHAWSDGSIRHLPNQWLGYLPLNFYEHID